MLANCKAKPTVLHLIDTTGPGGAETIFVQLADKMREHGWNTLVVIRGEGWVNDELLKRGLTPIILEAKGSFNVSFLWALIKLVRKHKVALIHSHLLGSNVYAALVGLLTFCPVVATYHGMVDISPNERFKTIKHWAMRWGIKRYVSVSKSLAASIFEKGLLAPQKTSVIYNGIDTSLYGKSESNIIRRQLGLSDDAVLVGSLGNIRPAKAYNILIEAVPQVLAEYPNVHFVIAGDPKKSLMAVLQQRVNELGIEKNIHFIGFQNDCAAMLAQMELFLLSSSSEGFSISTIEAMATGLPVIATKCGGPEEIITHQKNGWLIEKGCAEAIAEGVKYLLAHKQKRETLAKEGLRHVNSVFSSQNMMSSYNSVYESVARHTGP
jgi:glycosyltransferase involved in cell wall biosynthesis